MDTASKATYLFTTILVDILNATQTILFVPTWGYKDPKTGKINGMIGHLIDDEAHIGGTITFFSPERVLLVEYVSMTIRTNAYFVFRRPPLTSTSNIYSLPLSATVWICSVLLVVLSTAVIYITHRYSISMAADPNEPQSTPISDFILAAVCAICQKGSEFEPKQISTQISKVVSRFSFKFLFLNIRQIPCFSL